MQASKLRLYINIDHVATLRQARRGTEPDPVEAAIKAERSGAGADGITAHLREDRRHIQDDDIRRLRSSISSYFNLEMACTDEMVSIALETLPAQVTLVPERREEVTTEGGLDVKGNAGTIERVVSKLKAAGIRTSLFIDPDIAVVEWSQRVGAEAIELHTGQYAHRPDDPATLQALIDAARAAVELGIAVHAGHGLTASNVGPVAAILPIEELNIGHSIISRSIFVGLEIAIREVRDAMDRARREAVEQHNTP